MHARILVVEIATIDLIDFFQVLPAQIQIHTDSNTADNLFDKKPLSILRKNSSLVRMHTY